LATRDEAVHQELLDCQSELDQAERELGHISAAMAEQGRRGEAAAADAEAKRRQAAYTRACKLAGVRIAAATAVDDAEDALAAAIKWWVDTADEQDVALIEAGQRPSSNAADMRRFALEGSFKLAMRPLPHGLLAIEAVVPPGQQRRLSEADFRAVEPEPENERKNHG
jgi:hypothetical protein